MSTVDDIFNTIDNLIQNKKFEQAIEKLNHLIDLSLIALDYYHRYYKLYLGICIVLSCSGWIVYLLIRNIESNKKSHSILKKRLVDQIFLLILLVTVFLCFYQNFPFSYYLYTIQPIFLWRMIIVKKNIISYFYEIWSRNKFKHLFNLIALLFGIECLVLSFTYRWIFSVLLVFYSIYLLSGIKTRNDQLHIKNGTILIALILAIFPMLPVIKGFSHFYLVYISLFVMNLIYIYLMTKIDALKISKLDSIFLIGSNLASLINVVLIRKSIEMNLGLPKSGQLVSLLIIASCILIPTSSKPMLKKRLIFIIFTLSNLYFHLSISFESLFLIFLSLQMISWLLIESFKYCGEFSIDLALSKNRTSFFETFNEEDTENFNWQNVFRVYLLVFHLLIAFFGTGNMASINSFDPVSVYCFLTVFNPIVMGIMLFLKVVIPFLIVIAVFYCIFEVIDLSIRASFTLLMIISDIMALHFFFLIRTEGSWLDIGTSLSHYIIVMVKIIVVSVLFSIVQFLFNFELLNIKFFQSITNRFTKKSN